MNFAFYPAATPSDAEQMARGGVGSARFQLLWCDIEQQRGVYNWSAADETIGDLASQGVAALRSSTAPLAAAVREQVLGAAAGLA